MEVDMAALGGRKRAGSLQARGIGACTGGSDGARVARNTSAVACVCDMDWQMQKESREARTQKEKEERKRRGSGR